MILVKVIIVIVCMCIFTFLFKKASGGLLLKDLNIYSVGYYSLLLFAFIGASIVYIGFRKHYLLVYIIDDRIFNWGYFSVIYSVTALPLFIIIFNKLMGIKDYRSFYIDYRNRKVDFVNCNEKTVFVFTSILALVGTIALIYTFVSFGSIPLLDLLASGKFSMQTRISISRNFVGNEYVKNILALAMIPTLSYLSYIYFRVSHSKKWKRLFIYLFVLSIMCKTYNLEKSPLVFYLFYFYLIDCMLEKRTNSKKAYGIITLGAGILVGAYMLTGYVGRWISLSQGIFSRLLITHIAAYFLHLQSFSLKHPLLQGASFAKLLGGEGLRSGRIVMQDYNYLGVVSGTAGVMNTLYSGEAFANFGLIGILTSPIIVAFFMAIVPTFFLKQKKDPINITIYIMFASSYSTQLIAGYVDFFYNASAIILVFLLVGIRVLASGGKLYIKVRGHKI